MSLNRKKILLVGGTGYIGTALAKELHDDYAVVVTGRTIGNRKTELMLRLDFSNEKSVEEVLSSERFDIIIVLAARIEISHPRELDFQDPIFQDNVWGLNRFLRRACFLQKQAKQIFISSMTVYASDLKSPVPENAPLYPLHPYGLSKLMGEQIFSYYAANHDHSGVIFRLPGIFGGNRKTGYLYHLVDKLRTSQDIILDSAGLGFWESLYLYDFVNMFGEFLRNYSFSSKLEVFNMGYGEETDFITTAYTLKMLTGSSSRIIVKPKDYRKFFMSNQKIARYVNIEKYSYHRALKKLLKEQK